MRDIKNLYEIFSNSFYEVMNNLRNYLHYYIPLICAVTLIYALFEMINYIRKS